MRPINVFGAWPHPATWIGGTVIILSGLTILWREQRLHRARLASGEADAA